MVMPITKESDLKCYMCGEGFGSVEGLREHQRTSHGDSAEFDGPARREPAPGDVAVF